MQLKYVEPELSYRSLLMGGLLAASEYKGEDVTIEDYSFDDLFD